MRNNNVVWIACITTATLLLVGIGGSALANGPRTESYGYIGYGDPPTACQTESLGLGTSPVHAGNLYIGGACFHPQGSDVQAVIKIAPDDGGVMPGYYSLETADGQALASGAFCTSKTIPIPVGGVLLSITVQDPVLSFQCSPFGTIGAVGASGTVTVTFS